METREEQWSKIRHSTSSTRRLNRPVFLPSPPSAVGSGLTLMTPTSFVCAPTPYMLYVGGVTRILSCPSAATQTRMRRSMTSSDPTPKTWLGEGRPRSSATRLSIWMRWIWVAMKIEAEDKVELRIDGGLPAAQWRWWLRKRCSRTWRWCGWERFNSRPAGCQRSSRPLHIGEGARSDNALDVKVRWIYSSRERCQADDGCTM